MQPPCEIMVNEFLPNMRGLVSHVLKERNVSQNRIASLLGITQARVSHYLSSRMETFENNLARDFEISRLDLQGYAKILADDVTRNPVEGNFTLYSIWKNILFTGAACGIHRKISAVSADCSICMDLHRPAVAEKNKEESYDEQNILKDLSLAVSQIENSIEFPSIMPEVAVNIAMCKKNPRTSRDVAAIPGRINRIHGRAKALVSPEFGSSNHLSKVLIIFNSKDSRILAAMNVKYNKSIDSILRRRLGIPVTYTANSSGTKRSDESFKLTTEQRERELLTRLGKVELSKNPKNREFVVVDRGAEGLEPITYLLGSSSTDLSQLALRMASDYSRSSQRIHEKGN